MPHKYARKNKKISPQPQWLKGLQAMYLIKGCQTGDEPSKKISSLTSMNFKHALIMIQFK